MICIIAKLYSVVEQCLPYIGYPRALNAMNIIDDVSEQFARQGKDRTMTATKNLRLLALGI